MMQSTIGSSAAPADELPGLEYEELGGDRRRTLILVLGGVLLALLGAGLYLVLSGSGSDSVTETAPQVTKPVANPSTAVQPPAAVQQAAPVPLVRDPFANLPTTPPAGGGSATAATGAAAPQSTARTLTLISVNAAAPSAVFTVDGKNYAVKTGGSFATNFRLYALFGATCAGVLYGDQNIAICTGDAKQVGG